MRGNSHVRFGAGDEETCLGNGVRRFIPTLPNSPRRPLSLGWRQWIAVARKSSVVAVGWARRRR